MKYAFLIFLLIMVLDKSTFAVEDTFWREVPKAERALLQDKFKSMPSKYALYTLNVDKMRDHLNAIIEVPEKYTLKIPLPNSEMVSLSLAEKSVLAPELSAKFPLIKTFEAQAVNNPNVKGIAGVNYIGFHAMLFVENGRRVFIDRRKVKEVVYYISYFDSDYQPNDKTQRIPEKPIEHKMVE